MTPISPQRLDPWVAVNLSVLWPGLGQCYGKAWVKGIICIITTVGLLAYASWSIFGADGNTVTGLLVFTVVGMLYVINVFDAYNTLKPLPQFSLAVYQPKRNRWYAVFLSQILPGLGHLYLQQAMIGGILLAGGTITSLLANSYPALLPIPPFLWAIACYHIYRVAPSRSHTYPWIITTIIAGLLTVRLAVGFVPTLVNTTFLQFIVPSTSMTPTLQVNDRMFVYHHADYRPQHGDVVVFNVPETAIATLGIDPNTIFVKRIIGLPGQTVEVTQGTVYVNHIPLQEPYIKERPSYTLQPITLPSNAYFVLGDNRNESADSHVWGVLPKANILGRAYKIYWPPARIQSLRSSDIAVASPIRTRLRANLLLCCAVAGYSVS